MTDRRLSRKQTKLGPRSFWVGLMVMLVFAGSGLIGGGWAIDRILLEKALYDRGVVTSGVLLRKKLINAKTSPRGSSGTAYELTYRFDSDAGLVTGESRVSAKRFFSVKKGDPIRVRYLEDEPDRNLPDGSRLSGLFWFFAIFGLMVGLGASTVVIGMIVTRIRGDRK